MVMGSRHRFPFLNWMLFESYTFLSFQDNILAYLKR